MKKTCLYILALVLAGPAVLAADFESPGSITSVEVYLQGATVTRTTEVQLKTGTREVIFTGLPKRLDPGSLRVRAEGLAELKIAAVDLKTRYHSQPGNERIRELEAELETLNARKDVVAGDQELARRKKDFFVSIQATAQQNAQNSISGTPVTVADYQRAADYAFKGIADSMAALRDTSARLQTVNQDIDRRIRELDRLRNGQTTESLDAVITVFAGTAGKCRFALDYQVPDAAWTALYVSRLNPVSGNTLLEYKAQIRQQTGEDWPDVRMVLSTARPDQGTGAPDLNTWVIQPRPEPKYTERRNTLERGATEHLPSSDELFEGFAMSGGISGAGNVRVHEQAVPMTAAVEQAGVRVRFVVPAATSVPANGDLKSVILSETELSSEMIYRCTPRYSEKVYLTAKYANGADTPYLPGPVRIFYGNQFVGTGGIGLVAPGGEFFISYGSVDSITVDRRTIRQDRETTAFKRNIRWKHAYETTFENLLPYAVTVEIKDQVPVSRDERIEVVDVRTNPPAEGPDTRGILTWKLPLEPTQKTGINLAFEVVHPEDLVVQGF